LAAAPVGTTGLPHDHPNHGDRSCPQLPAPSSSPATSRSTGCSCHRRPNRTTTATCSSSTLARRKVTGANATPA